MFVWTQKESINQHVGSHKRNLLGHTISVWDLKIHRAEYPGGFQKLAQIKLISRMKNIHRICLFGVSDINILIYFFIKQKFGDIDVEFITLVHGNLFSIPFIRA